LICVLASIVLLATSIDLIRRFIATPDIPIASPIVTRFDYHDANDPSPVSKKGDFARARSPINHDSTEPNDMGLTEDPAHHVPLLEPPPPPPPESLWLKALFSFSIPVNLAKLTKHFPNNKTNLNPLNMVRVMAMMWVVLGHTALFTVFIGYTNPIQAVKRLLPSVPFQILLNGTLSVDVFFYLAGFLMAYFTLKELRQRNGKMNWIIVFLHRLWRMGPTMVLALFFCWTVAPSMGNGPWWRTFMTWTTEACSKYWWTNLLFINNFWNFDLDQTCLGWSWYMSTDMQFFLLAIPIVYIIYKRPKLGFILIAILSVASLSFVAGISAKRHLSPMVTHMDDGFRKYLYTKPWARISTFFIGIIGAYLLLDHEDRAQSPHGFRKLPLFKQSILVTASWIIAIVMVLVPIFATYSAYQYQAKPWSNAANAAFLTLSRPCFTLGLAIMAHLVMTSRASVSIKHAMSHPLWTPLARLTFGAYLYHPIIMYSYYFSSTRPLDMTGTLIFQNWIFFTILSFLASFVSFLLIERPTENLEGILIDIMKEKAKMNRHQRQELHHSDLEAAEQKVSLLSEAEDKALDDGEHHL
jgi:peptidoglycan/LPS O-acetylase OafA/YrhL